MFDPFASPAAAFQEFVRRAGALPIFTQGQSGVLYHLTTYVELGELKVEFPCVLTARAARKWIITDVEGLPETVKEDMGYAGCSLSLSGEAGDYDLTIEEKVRTGNFNAGVRSSPFLRELQRLMKCDREEHRMPMPIKDKDGLLDALGVSHVVLKNLSLTPSGPKRFQFTLEMDSDVDPSRWQTTAELFPEA